MFKFRSLRSRITVLYSATFGAALLFISIAMHFVISHNAEQQVREDLQASSKVIDSVWSMRFQQLRDAATPLAQDFGFREAVATDDDATMRSALQNMAARLNSPSAFIVKYDGRVVGLSAKQDAANSADLWSSLDEGWQSGALRYNGASYLGVAAEINAPSLIGWLVIARPLDAKELQAINDLSFVPLSVKIVRREVGQSWVNDISGKMFDEPATMAMLNSLSPGDSHAKSGIMEVVSDNVVHVRALGSHGETVETALILEYSTAAALAKYDGLKYAIGITGFLGLLLALLASSRVATSIARPLTELEAAATKLQHGERITVSVVSSDEIGRLSETFNTMSAEIVEREHRISHMAFHDALTNLPNRLLFQEQLDVALRQATHRNGELAVLCLDLDNFKIINDTLGHPIGDELLKVVGKRVREIADQSVVARLGGDEFAILLTDETQKLRPEFMARSIIDAVCQPVEIDGHQLVIGGSIGIALAPADSNNADDLMKHADLALYKSKEGGRGTFRFFETQMDEQAQERRALEMDMRSGLKNGEFELYFQPLFDLSKNAFCGFEALIRWNHPTRGQISPLDFIPVAEETGLIIPIGEWVIHEGCRHARDWPDNIRVAVNVSTVQFRSPGLVAIVMQALAATGLAPNRLEIEITESIFLDSTDAILDLLHGLRALGVRIALDDFGTGYSSLSYLRSFPFDKIKIDRSFIMELIEDKDAGAVVRAITDLAGALGMETTAEGVEEVGQVEALREHGCTNVQGYLFSKPVAASDALALINGEAVRAAA